MGKKTQRSTTENMKVTRVIHRIIHKIHKRIIHNVQSKQLRSEQGDRQDLMNKQVRQIKVITGAGMQDRRGSRNQQVTQHIRLEK